MTAVWDLDWRSDGFFLKQVLSGMFITIAMTGLDQEMMQKNLSVATVQGAQENMRVFSVVLLGVNTQTDLAGLVGCSVSTINRHIKQGRVLDPKVIVRIYFITLTAVRPDDFYDLESKPPEVAQLMHSAKARELRR